MFRKIVLVFSSLKLTIGILLSLGALIGYATFVEVDAATGAIRRDFYRTPGFLGILVMLGVNLSACTAKRAPFKAHQIGYVTTHGGLMMILVGSILTFRGGVEGIVALSEKGDAPGEATRSVFQRTDTPPDLVVSYVEGGRAVSLGRFPVSPAIAGDDAGSLGRVGGIVLLLAVIAGVLFLLRIWEKGDWYRPIPFVFLGAALLACAWRVLHPPQGELPCFPVTRDLEAAVTETLPHAVLMRRIRGGGTKENPALLVELRVQGQAQERRWLFEKDPTRSHFQAGPLLVAFVGSADLESISEELARQTEGALVRLTPGGELSQVWVKEARDDWRAFGEGWEIRVDQFFTDLAVDSDETDLDEKYVNSGESLRNPAVLFHLRRAGQASGMGTFLARPDSPVERVSGELEIPQGAEFRFDPHTYLGYRLPMVLWAADLGAAEEPAKIRYLCTSRRGEHQTGTASVGQEIRYPFMPLPLDLRVTAAEPKAWEEISLGAASDPQAPPGLGVRLTTGGRSRETGVLLDGGPSPVLFEGDAPLAYALDYRRAEAPLGFSLTLDDFRKVDYPGTEDASSYESDVTVVDGAQRFSQKVWVNHPLVYRGFTFYQSSYIVDERGRQMSVFAVARDPGARLVYLGFAVFGLGLILIFYLKPILLARQKRPLAAGGG